MPYPNCRFYIIIIVVTFYPNGCSQFENPEAPDFEKIASASGSFSTLSLPSSLPLPTSFIKVLPLLLPQKISASTASASTSLSHFTVFHHIHHFAWVKSPAIQSKILNVIGSSGSRSSYRSFPICFAKQSLFRESSLMYFAEMAKPSKLSSFISEK